MLSSYVAVWDGLRKKHPKDVVKDPTRKVQLKGVGILAVQRPFSASYDRLWERRKKYNWSDLDHDRLDTRGRRHVVEADVEPIKKTSRAGKPALTGERDAEEEDSSGSDEEGSKFRDLEGSAVGKGPIEEQETPQPTQEPTQERMEEEEDEDRGEGPSR